MASDLASMNGGSAKAPGLPVSQLNDPQSLTAKYESLKRNREMLERQWKLNLAFYKGKQYTYYNKAARKILSLPTEEGEKPRYRVRVISNQIISGAQSLLAKYLKTRPQMMASPGSGNDSDVKAAEMAELLLEYWWQDFQMDDLLEEAMLWGIVAGQGYWKVCWDDAAGKQMSFMLDPQGQPILDEAMQEEFRAQLAQFGITPQEQVVYLGDVRVEVVSPFDVYFDPTARSFKDVKWAIQVAYLEPDTIKARYPKANSVTPDSVPATPDLGITNPSSSDFSVKKVLTGYFLPTPAMPKGRIVTWTDKQILEDKAWDHPTNKLPFVKFPGLRVPGELYDSSVIEHAISIQKELNRTLSQIVEAKNLTVRPQWMAPVGAMRTRRTDEPGAVWEYNPVGGQKPEPVPIQPLPAYVFEHLADLKLRLDDIFGKTEITEGAVPPNVEAGVAIDLLQEMAVDRFVSTIRLMELSIARAGQLMLEFAQKYYIEPRLIKVAGSTKSTQAKQFTRADIDGNISVHVETGSGLPRTRAGRQARIEWMIESGLIRPYQAWKHVDLADMKNLSDSFALDEDQAYRENEKLNVGEPINPVAMQQAQQSVQQAQQTGQNPDTGQPFESMQDFMLWAQQTMQSAAVTPGLLDNHQVHMDIHGRVIKSIEFESLDPQLQQMYMQHVQQHFQIWRTVLPIPNPEAPKINLQLKSTVGPSTQEKILTQAGIPVTTEDTSEPPLETWVSDSVDDPDVDGGSPGEDGGVNLAKVAQITANAQAQALATHNQAHANSVKQQVDTVGKMQKIQQAAELHQVKMRQAQAQAEAAQRKAKERPPSGGSQ